MWYPIRYPPLKPGRRNKDLSGRKSHDQFTRRTVLTGAAAAGAATLTPAPLRRARRRSASGKQAPGWYRYKVGSFEVTVVTDGGSRARCPTAYVANAPRRRSSAALQADFLDGKTVTHNYTPVVINTGTMLVAIDAGLGQAMFKKTKGALGQYHANLQAAGIDRNAVDVVIISHFHGDHINGLIGADNKPAFPNAEVMVPATEWILHGRREMSRCRTGRGHFRQRQARVRRARRQSHALRCGQRAGARHHRGRKPRSHARPHFACGRIGQCQGLVQADVTAAPPGSCAILGGSSCSIPTRRRRPAAVYDMVIAERCRCRASTFRSPRSAHIEKSGNGYRLVPVPWNPVL